MDFGTTLIIWGAYIVGLYITIFWLMVFISREMAFKEEEDGDRALLDFPTVTVVIPAYNEEHHIYSCLESIFRLEYPPEKLQVIVINDGSKDKTAQKVKKFMRAEKTGNRLTLISKANSGKANSLNIALQRLHTKLFVCLDADSTVEPDTLKKMVHTFEKGGSRLAIVTPAMKVKKPKKFFQKLQRIEYISVIFVARLMSQLDCLYVAPGPFSLYRTSIIKKLGGFSESNLTEDMEIAYRVQKHNYKIKQCFDANVYTIAPENTRELYKQRNRWYKGGLLNAYKYRNLFLNKNYGDFGIMQMSVNVFNFFLAIAGLTLFSYFFLYPIIKQLWNTWLIRFDLLPYLEDFFTFKFTVLDIDISNVFIFVSLFLITFATVVLAHRNAKEKVRKASVFQILYYFFLYYIMLSFITLIVILEVIIGKRQKW